MSKSCTYVGCENVGVGRTAETASNWLCEEHLAEFERRAAAVRNDEDKAMPRLCGFIVRAGGGAQAMTKRMAPAIAVGARAIAALRSHTQGEG